MSYETERRDARLIRDEERAKVPSHIKGEPVRTLSGIQHDGTRSFEKRVHIARAAAKRARAARRRNRRKK